MCLICQNALYCQIDLKEQIKRIPLPVSSPSGNSTLIGQSLNDSNVQPVLMAAYLV